MNLKRIPLTALALTLPLAGVTAATFEWIGHVPGEPFNCFNLTD